MHQKINLGFLSLLCQAYFRALITTNVENLNIKIITTLIFDNSFKNIVIV